MKKKRLISTGSALLLAFTLAFNGAVPAMAAEAPAVQEAQQEEQGYTVRIIPMEHGTVTFSGDEKKEKKHFEPGETVTVIPTPKEGYQIDSYSVMDSKGNEIEPNTAQEGLSFAMPESADVTVCVAFRELEELKSEDVTKDQDVSKSDIKEAMTDPALEKYIRENADPKYTSVDQVKLANSLLVKHTMFDRTKLKADDTIIWENNGEQWLVYEGQLTLHIPTRKRSTASYTLWRTTKSSEPKHRTYMPIPQK